eukprot:CAMPEP_0179023476 /NCGR_PEP_ID=MMETSP0796-20121207/6949_1 /TAXON_ID=73915 /ORGANISM="Pyrodinium bahamense, Strain pbaha01" /LENGTH=430 /DNA_ID=CAMNT_0020719387 /DNA_START=93 /DNA_END=1385 /DNA_ORIENTATION=+
MGNSLTSALEDITEDGNTWRDDRIVVPLGEDLLEKLQPNLVVAPAVPTITGPRAAVGTVCEVSEEEASTYDGSEQGRGDGPGQEQQPPPTPQPSPAPSPRAEDLQQRPVQLVLQPSAHGGAAWRPLGQCAALQGHILLTQSRMAQLRPFLPVVTRFASCWQLIYSPRVHGVSLGTFFRQCQAWPGETLLLVEDASGTVFGGFASHTWQASRQQVHAGRPECFVFTFGSPAPRCLELTVDEGTERLGFVCTGWPPTRMVISRVQDGTWAEAAGLAQGDELLEVDGCAVTGLNRERLDQLMRKRRPLRLTFSRHDGLVVYPWTGANQCFMFADNGGLSMGGGKSVAFWINKDFLQGTSAPCETFGTPGALASGPEFVVRNFECWAFDHSLTSSQAPTPDNSGFLSHEAVHHSGCPRLRVQADAALRFAGGGG